MSEPRTPHVLAEHDAAEQLAPGRLAPEHIVPDEVTSDQAELLPAGLSVPQDEAGEVATESVDRPAKVMRIGSMVKQLLDEVRAAPLDDASRLRLAAIYERSIDELAGALSPDLQDELRSLAPPFAPGSSPSDAELRIAQAQLVGWLEGLFHGIQATLFAQQIAARQQLEQMRGQLPPGAAGREGGSMGADRPGTYL